MADPKTIEVTITVKVKNSANSEEARRVITKTTEQMQATQHFPQLVAANQTNFELFMGGISQAKTLLIECDQPTTVILNTLADTGFDVTDFLLVRSNAGISKIYVTTGVNATYINVLAAGS